MITLWSPKGGQGTSVTVAALALTHLRRHGGTAVLVDLAGDQRAVLASEATHTVGVSDWLAAECAPDALARTAHRVTDGLTLVPRGEARPASRGFDPARVEALWEACGGLGDLVLVDAGVPGHGGSTGWLGVEAVRAAQARLVVLRSCYLALRRFGAADLGADGLVFVREPQRALVASDLEATVGAPTLATVELDPAVARSVDAGLLTSRLPRRLERSLADVVPRALEVVAVGARR
ncbi:MAG: cellulose synthase operon protein YhjQ/BcsQ [Microthrixaceae bacterium]